MQTFATALACMVLVSDLVFGQAVLQPAPSETHRLSVGQSVTIPIKCDGDGNLYLRSRAAGPATFDVVQFSPEGTKKTTYKSSDAPGFGDAFVHDFSIGSDGRVYELVQASGGEVFVLKFSSNGQFDSKTELTFEKSFMPSQLVALTGGGYFISGTQNGDEPPVGNGGAVNAIFDDSGNLVRQISLKADSKTKKGDSKSEKSHHRPEVENAAVRFGRALLGYDGNIYLMRASTPPIVYVVSPSGKLVHTVKLQSPFEKGTPIALMMDGGRLAIEFSDPVAEDTSSTTVRVVNAQTGDKIADYRIAPELTEAVACYSDNKFTFLGNSNGWPAIMQVTAY